MVTPFPSHERHPSRLGQSRRPSLLALFFSLAALLLTSALPAQADTWRPHGAGSDGRILYKLWFADATTGWTVGQDGLIYATTDGGAAWNQQTSGTLNPLNGVYGLDASNVWAVGGFGTILKWDGATWSAQTSGSAQTLNGVWVSDASNAWAVGSNGTILKWNGTTWSAQTSGTTQSLFGVWGSDASNVWAVGGNGTILKWNGTAWSAQTSGTTQPLLAVWGSGAGDVWAVGSLGTILKWNGSAWSAQTSGTTLPFYCVWGADANTVWAVGSGPTIRKTTNGGATWTAQSISASGPFYGVWGSDASNIWVSAGGAIFKGNGTTWSSQASFGVYYDLTGVWGLDASNLWAVGFGGAFLKWNGSAWIPQSSSLFSLYSVWGVDANNIWGVGSSGAIRKWNGTAWSTQTSGTTQSLNAVWAADANNVWAVGDGGTILKWNGSAWSAQTSGTTLNLVKVWGSDANNVWAVGHSGTILKWNGTAWSAQTSGTVQNILGVWASDANTLWAVGTSGTIRKTTNGGATWNAQTSGATVTLRGVWGSDANTVWAMGDSGAILKTANGGSTWTADTSNTRISRRAMWGSSATAMVVVGDYGFIQTNAAATAPSVTTPTSTGVTGSSATLGGTVAHDNGSPVTERGVVVSITATNGNPLIGGAGVTKVTASGTTGVFTVPVTGLGAATAYTFKAYAANAQGTNYTSAATFSTWSTPTVTTPTRTAVTGSSATLGGNVTSDGGTTVTERGVVVSVTATNGDPLLGGAGVTKVTASGTTGVFTVPVTGLSTGTTLTFKAYATNAMGTSYTSASTFMPTVVDTWRPHGLGSDGRMLAKMWFSDVNTGWTVGQDGLIYATTNAGATWSRQTSGTLNQLTGVWGSDASNVWAVGFSATILKWNGSAWSAQTSGTPQSLTGVWGSDANNVWAVGTSGTIRKWNGTSWSAQTSGTTQTLNGVWGSDANNVWAVGASGTILRTTNGGASWSVQTSGTTQGLNGVWGSDASNVWAVGTSGTILKWNGSAWSAQNSGTGFSLNGVWGADANNVWAVGSGGSIRKTTNGGATWTAQTSGTAGELYGVWGSDAGNVWVSGAGAILKGNGVTWSTQISSGDGNHLYGLWGLDANNVWAVGVNGVFRKWNGSTWSTQANSGVSLVCVWGIDANNIWAAGSLGSIRKWNGSAWSAQASGATQTLNGLWGIDANNIWAVGVLGSIRKWNGTAWSAQTSGTTQDLRSVWGSDANNVWAVGGGGTILKWNGTAWSAQTSGTTQTLNGVWGSDANNVWAVGSTGAILKWNGTAWSAQTSGTSVTLLGVRGIDANNVWAVGNSGAILKTMDGGSTWISDTSNTTITRLAVWGSSATTMVTSGINGFILTNAPVTPPTVTTPTSADVAFTSATLGGTVFNDNGATVTERGVVVSVTATNGNPLIGGAGVTKVTASGTTDVFTVPMTGLSEGTGYTFKAYATNAQGTNYTGAATFTTLAVPTVTGISPSGGPTAGGASVTITGAFFTGVTAVTIGGVAATGVNVVNATTLTAVTPPGGAGPASVLVTTLGGTNAANTLYTYFAPPAVTGIDPTSGPTGGGASVTITGDNFIGTTAVTIGGAEATGVSVVNASTITATTPPGGAGPASVRVTTPGGTTATNTLYTYVGQPAVTGILPSSGRTAGGTPVTITGVNFLGANAVTIGGAAATGVSVVNATTITALTPAGSAGPAGVLVTTLGGTNPANTLFDYTPNTAPADLTLGNTTLAENNAPNATVGVFSVTDPNVEDAHAYAFQAGPGDADNGAFTLTGNTLRINGSADFESQPSYAIRVVATDDGAPALSVTNTFTIGIQDRNDAPAFTAGAVPAVDEDAGPQSLPGWATGISDGDPGVVQTLAFSIGANSHPGLFSAGPAVDANTGDLTFTTAANSNGTATVEIVLTDDSTLGGPARSVTNLVTFTVNPVNDDPILPGAVLSAEDAGPVLLAGWANDGDPELAQTLSFSIVTNSNPSLFLSGPVVAANGDLTYTSATNANGTATVEIVLTDDATAGGPARSVTNIVTFTVDAVNDQPRIVFGTPVVVAEDSGPHSISDWKSGLEDGDPEVAQSMTLALQSVQVPALFSAGPSLDVYGNLEFTPAPDASGSSKIWLRLVDDATAGGGPRTNVVYTELVVVPANDPPSFTGGPALTVPEASTLRTTLVGGWATHFDDGEPFVTQSLFLSTQNNSNPGLFASGPTLSLNGTITYSLTPNVNGSATVEFVLTDDANRGGPALSVTNILSLTVTPVNGKPAFVAGPAPTVNEDAGPQTLANWATGLSDGDPELVQSLSFSLGSNSNPGLFIAGPAVDAVGTLTFTPAPDANGISDVQIVLTDDATAGGPARSVTNSVRFTVNKINDPPSFTAGPPQVVNEDSGSRTVAGWASNLNDGDANVTQTLTFSIASNSNPSLFSVAPSISSIGTLYYTPAANKNGTALLQVVLTDNTLAGGPALSVTNSLSITVTPVNDTPSAPRDMFTNVTSDEDAGPQVRPAWTAVITDGDPEVAQTVTFEFTYNSNPGLFSALPAITPTGDFTWTTAPNASGSAYLHFWITDDATAGGPARSIGYGMYITVNKRNDAPSFTAGAPITVNEDAGARSFPAWATAITDGDTETLQALGFSVTNNTNAGLFSVAPAVSATGTLTFTPAPHANGTASMQVVLTDDAQAGGPALQFTNTLSVTVTAINDEPSFVKGSNLVVAAAAGAQSLPGWATVLSDNDPEVAQTLSFEITGNTNPGILSGAPALSPDGTLSFIPATTGCGGTTTISVRLRDDGGTSSGGDDTSPVQTFTLTVTSPEIDVAGSNVLSQPGGTLAFGERTVGETFSRSLVVANLCEWPLELSGISLASGTAFTLAPGAPGVIPGGGQVTLTLNFTASAPGPHTDTLVIHSNDPDEPVTSVPLEGSGAAVPDPLACSPNAATDANGTLHAATAGDSAQGQSLAAGDVNGDGIDDWIVALPLADSVGPNRTDCGRLAVYFGRTGFTNGVMDVAGTHGLAPDVLVTGTAAGEKLGLDGALRLADLNGDGILDIVVGTPLAKVFSRTQAGAAYIVFGRTIWPATLDLAVFGSALLIAGAEASGNLGSGGALATGDFNGDGIDDLALGAANATPGAGRVRAGRAYLVRGRATWPGWVDLASAASAVIHGADEEDRLTEGGAIALGDVDGDGLDDLVLGAPRADGPANARDSAGEAYVVRGRAFPGVALQVDLSLGQQDQTIQGATALDQLALGGALVVADLTGDGRAEIIVGSSQGDGPAEDRANAGELAIVLGAMPITNTVDLATGAPVLTRVHGAHAGDLLSSGGAIRVGNVSGNSLPELIVGAEGAAGPFNDRSSAGAVYVLPITNTWPAVIDLASPPSGAFVAHGATTGDRLTRNGALRLGDLNGDGLQDLILGADGGDGPANARAACGEVEVVFGQATWANPFLDLSQALDGTFLTLSGGSANDELSKNNALATGDLDGDGIVDLLAGAPGVDGPAGSTRANAGALYRLRGKPGALACGGGLLTIGFRVEPPAPAETPAPAPVIDALELAESGESANQLWGEAGYRYVLESSTDLVHWTAVAGETPARSGLLNLFDRAAAGQGTLYYRVRRER